MKHSVYQMGTKQHMKFYWYNALTGLSDEIYNVVIIEE